MTTVRRIRTQFECILKASIKFHKNVCEMVPRSSMTYLVCVFQPGAGMWGHGHELPGRPGPELSGRGWSSLRTHPG